MYSLIKKIANKTWQKLFLPKAVINLGPNLYKYSYFPLDFRQPFQYLWVKANTPEEANEAVIPYFVDMYHKGKIHVPGVFRVDEKNVVLERIRLPVAGVED